MSDAPGFEGKMRTVGNEFNGRVRKLTALSLLVIGGAACAATPTIAAPPTMRPDRENSRVNPTLVQPTPKDLSSPTSTSTPPPPEASPTPFPQPYEINGDFYTRFKIGIGGGGDGNGFALGPKLWGLNPDTFPQDVGKDSVTALKYVIAHILDRVINVPPDNPYHLTPPAFALLPQDEGMPPSQSNKQPMRPAVLQTGAGINTSSGEIQPQTYVSLMGYDGGSGTVLIGVANSNGTTAEFRWVNLKDLDQLTNSAGIKGKVTIQSGYYGYLYVGIDGETHPLNTFGDQSIIEQINADIAQTKAKKATPAPEPTNIPEPTQIPPTNIPNPTESPPTDAPEPTQNPPTNTPKPPTRTPIPEQPKAPDWWNTEEGREGWVNTIPITDTNEQLNAEDRQLLREYIAAIHEYQNNTPSAIDPMFSVVSYPKAADPNPVMALLSNNNLKKISMHGAGGFFNDPAQRRIEIDIDSTPGYSLPARKIINAAFFAKEAWAIKWIFAEKKPNFQKIDAQSHALMLSIIKYYAEKHPDEGVRAELLWYYTKWIEDNSLGQLIRPRTNEELTTSLQHLYSYSSDSLGNGFQPKELDAQREIVRLQNQIVRAKSQKEAARLKLALLTLQDSL